MALHMLQKRFDYRTIAEITQLSADVIEALAKKNHLTQTSHLKNIKKLNSTAVTQLLTFQTGRQN